MNLQEAVCAIRPPDEEQMALAKSQWDQIAKPLHALGLLEDAIVRIAGITRSSRMTFSKRAVVVFCADNGVVAQGVTQAGSEVTAAVTENLARGQASVNCMAAVAHAAVIPVDMGVAYPLRGPGLDTLRVHKVAHSTADMTKGAAMTRGQALDAVEYGIQLAFSLRDEGYRLLATGEMGIGNTTTSSALTSVFLGCAPQEVTGRGAGLSAQGLCRKVDAVRRAVALNQPNPNDALDVLHKVGGLDIAGMAGLYIGGAAAGIPVLTDGFISAAAALTAVRFAPMVRDYLLASHVSAEPAAQMLLDALGLQPLLCCGMCLGEGTGAVAALPLLDMALAVYDQASTFHDIGVDEYLPQE